MRTCYPTLCICMVELQVSHQIYKIAVAALHYWITIFSMKPNMFIIYALECTIYYCKYPLLCFIGGIEWARIISDSLHTFQCGTVSNDKSQHLLGFCVCSILVRCGSAFRGKCILGSPHHRAITRPR